MGVLANVLQPLIDVANEILIFLHDDVGLHYGAAIVGLTFITRIAILPLSIKQIRSMRALSAIQPHVKEIQDRYKDDKQRMQREMMAVYQEHGVNPFASCVPLLLQIPVFITLFYLLNGDAFKQEVATAGENAWFFIDDLVEPATAVPLVVLLVLYIVTSIAAGVIMTGANATKQQKMLTLGLPLVFTPIMIGFPAGLLIYWISTNVWTMGQQGVVRLFFPAPEPPTPEEVRASKPPPAPPRKRKRRR